MWKAKKNPYCKHKIQTKKPSDPSSDLILTSSTVAQDDEVLVLLSGSH